MRVEGRRILVQRTLALSKNPVPCSLQPLRLMKLEMGSGNILLASLKLTCKN